MGTLTDRIRQAGRESAIPSEAGMGVGYVNEREKAIIDRHKQSVAGRGSLFQKAAQGRAEIEIAARQQQRAYAEKPQSTLAQITVDPAREMVENLVDRAKVLDTLRKLSPEQREEALRLAPGIAQQLGDDRGGAVGRTLGALSRGVSSISQPAMELAGKLTGTDWGGTPEEIEFIRQLEGVASQEFAPALSSDPWYERFPLQAAEMVPFSAATVGGGVVGGAIAKKGAQLLARGAAAGVPGANAALQAAGAVGRLPSAIGLPAATAQGVGTVAGITTVGFPGQYAQEIDQLKELGVQDGPAMQSLAVGTALASSALEAIMPNPFPAGGIDLKKGAITAARQYLWEAAKRAPGEISEEYAQGLASGLGKTVASYLDMTTKDVTLGDAFAASFEQGNAAIGPMAFLLGVPALAGAGAVGLRARGGTPPGPPPVPPAVTQEPLVQPSVVAPSGIPPAGTLPEVTPPVDQTAVVPTTTVPQDQSQRLTRLQEIRAKGPVSRKDGIELGIKGNQDERTAIVDAEIEQLSGMLPQPPLQGVPDASQIPTNEARNDAGGYGGEGSQVDSGSQVRQQGQDQGGTQPTSQEPQAQEVQVGTYEEFRDEYRRLFSEMMKYSPDEVGSSHFAEKMAVLSDKNPEWAERVESEQEVTKQKPVEPRKFSYQNGRVQVEVPPPYEVGGKSVQPFVMNGKTYIGAEDFKANAAEAYAETVKRYPDIASQEVVPVSDVAKPPVTPAPQQTEATTGTTEKETDNTESLRKMLADVDAQITKQGRVVDDRLLSRKRELERLLKEPSEKTETPPPIKIGDHVRVEGTDIAGSVGTVQTSKGVLINHFDGGSSWHPSDKVRTTERQPDFVDDLVDKLEGKKPAAEKPRSEPPEGYKPLAEFTPSVVETKSPDLELRDNVEEMKILQLKKGDAVGYRVYPDTNSTAGGYWQYGNVASVIGSHAHIKLADGKVERVGGSRILKLEPTGEQDTGTERELSGNRTGTEQPEAGGPTTTEEQKKGSGSISIDEFADIFANPEQTTTPTESTPKKPRSIRKDVPSEPKSTGKKKTPSESVQEGLNEAKEGADLIRKGLKDLGSSFFSGPPINADIARGMGMMANGLIKAGKYKFAEFIDEAVKMIGAKAVRYLGPYLEAGWNKKAETDSRLDKATSVAEYLADEPEVASAQTRIANRVRDALENGETLTSGKFFAIADEELGGTRANNDYGDSQATDALELGVNLYLRDKTDANVSPDEAKATLERIQQVMQLVPRHRGRTGNKDLMQQFSTPPAYAYAVNWIANITDADVVLEPSAGMGGIAIHAANSGAKVYANELDPARAEGLRELPLEQVFTEDAEQIGAILKGKTPGLNVILMNPPFSRAGMRMGDRMVQGTDRKHINEALGLLPEGGRLVAIVGAGLHGQGQKMTQWLDNLPYQLVANIEVAREVYRGYGTEFPTRVLVIDKVPRTDSVLVREAGSLSELIDIAEGVRNARRIRDVESVAAQPDSSQGTGEDGQGARATDDARDTTATGVPDATDSGAGQAEGGQRGSDRGGSVDDGNAATGAAGSSAGSGRGGRKSGGQTRKPGGPSKGTKAKPSGAATAGKSDDGGRGSGNRGGGLTKVKATSKPRAASVKTELGDSTFEVYTPSVVVEGAKPHPAPIVESAAMAAVDAPRIDYEVDLMPGAFEGYVNDDGFYVGISDIQLEAIAMAGAAHEQKLPSGERRGFLIGDGTGVGKAREALGIIMDDFIKRGTGERRKAVFITKNDGLVKDAVGEWVGVGGDATEMQALSNVGSGESVKYGSGVLTLSYDTLKGEASVQAKSQGNSLSRVEQIIDWVGEDFDGVVVFDEAHLMANSMDTGTGNQTKGASKRALAGVDLQQRLPNARFVYLSATAATEVRNLAYAERLGLWGPGTSFDSKHRFVNEIESGGVAAMEKVAADMKAMGMYVARNLSFDDGTENGRVEFDRIQHTLSSDQRRVYDKLSEAWLKVLADIDKALDLTDNQKGKSRILSAFWGSNQRFWNDVVTTMMAPSLIKGIESDLAAGRSVVIQLSTTKEAATGRAIASMQEGQTYDEIDASPRRSLMEYVERAFPTQRHETYIDEAGNERSRPVVDSEGNPVHDPQAVAMKERLLDEIGSLDVAARGPIDMILDHFGTDMVAEISGRSQRLVKGDDGRLELEKRGKAAARADRDSFMDGKKRVLLFSEAGGTGASYHASLSVANQQRRSHYLWQPGWSAPVAVQGLGRAHRSNQASAPILHLLEPNLEGYKRFISTIARRLGQLGALTKGQRTAADAGLFGANDNLESTEANSALFQFMSDAVNGNIDGIDRDFLVQRLGMDQLAGGVAPSPEMFTMTQFLNRMLNLPLGEQSRVFGEFQSRLDNIVAQAIQDGTLDQGMETLKAERIVKANETVVNEHKTGAKTKLVELTLTHKVKPKSFEDMLQEAASYTQFSTQGFVKSNTTGKVFAVINQNRTSQDTNGRTLHDAMFIGVGGNSYGHSLEQVENAQHWERLPREQARELWDKQFRESPTTRESTTHLLTGALLPVWSKIPGNQSRVLRALTADGETILGRVIPEKLLQRTLDSFGVSSDRNKRQYTPLEGIQAIYQGGTVELVNGWKIKKRTIDGEDNIEIIGPDYSSTEGIMNAGGFTRRIDYKTRFFIPFNDTKGEVLGEITKISPISSIVASRSGGEGGGIASMVDSIPTRQSRTARRKSEVEKTGIAAADIQKTAERLFDVPIRQGGFNQRAAGIYKWITKRNGPPSPEVIRTTEDHYANLAVVAHEIAHHIDERTKAVRSMPKAVKDEVSKLDYEPEKGRAFEGWAEFLRRYMTEPPIDVNGTMMPNPGIDAPQTLAWFEGTFLQANADVGKAIAEFRKYAQQFAQQSVFQRVSTLISDRQPHDLSFKERWLSKSKRWLHRLKTIFVDKFHTLEWIQEEANRRGRKGVGIYDLTMAYFMSATSHATIAFEEGVRNLQTGKPIGTTTLWGLREHLKSDGEYEDATLYALARHTVFMADKKPGYNTGMDIEDAEAWIAEVEANGQTERFEAFAEDLAQFNNDLLEMLVQAGALSPSDAATILDYYGGKNYFPLHRAKDSGMFTGTGVGFVNLGKAVRRRTQSGSGQQIIDPVDATVAQAIRYYGRAIQARQQHVLAETLDPKRGGVGGMGGLMDRVDPKRVVHRGTIKEILGTLVEEGVVEADDAKAMRIASAILDGDGMLSQDSLEWFAKRHGIEIDDELAIVDAAKSEPNALAFISLWRPDYTPNATKRTVMIYDKNGEPLMYELDPDLYSTATGMEDIQFSGFMSTLREASRYFKSGAVGLSTGFGTANLLRDYWEFQGKARHTKGLNSLGKPPEMLGRYIAAKAKRLTGAKKADDALVRLYEETGGKVYSVVGHDVHGQKMYRRRRLGKTTMSRMGVSLSRPLDTAERGLQAVQELIAISDAPPRMADAEAAIKEEGYERRQDKWYDLNSGELVDQLPEHVRIKAAVAMSEATINFKRIGSKGQYVEAFMPFFNATVQAMYRQYKQVKGLKSVGRKDAEGMQAKRYLVYLSALASTAVFYWMLRNDDDDWREQDSYLRDGFWTWGKNGKTYVRIPKPRDSAVVSNVVENMLDSWYHDDARPMPELMLRDFGGRLPTGGGLARGVIEAYIADYDYFRERDLTPYNMQKMPKEFQVTSYTSRVSDTIGKVTGRYLNTSPIQVEHLLNSASGGLYHRMTELYEAADEGRIGPEHYPFIRAIFIDRHQARSVNDFYDKLEETDEASELEKAAEGVVSDATIGKLAVLEAHAELMTTIRNMEGRKGKRREYEYQPYIVGLARQSLGYKALANNPNPLFDKDISQPIADVMQDYKGRVVVQASETLKKLSEYKNKEDYEDQRKTIVRGKAKLQSLGLNLVESKKLLEAYWRSRGWKVIKDNVYVDAIRTRFKELDKLFAAE